LVEIGWTLADIENLIKTNFCPNPNWTLTEWGIEGIYVYHAAYKQDNKGNLYVSSELCRRCEVKPGSEFGEENEYGDCGVACTDLSSADLCKERTLNTLCWDAVSPLFP
jgi:hypothetical protein